jgi:hypothetical protein
MFDGKKRIQVGRRPKGNKWDYNWDGQFRIERYSADDKRFWRRWWRRRRKKDLENETW